MAGENFNQLVTSAVSLFAIKLFLTKLYGPSKISFSLERSGNKMMEGFVTSVKDIDWTLS